MKKLILLSLLSFMTLGVYAQEENNSDDFNKWQVRFRFLTVAPNDSADIEVIGGDSDISTAATVELDFTYFFTKNLAAELILGTAKHEVEVTDTAAGDIDLGHVWLLPPTLTLQYHFYAGDLKPYLGAGVNYTIFYGVDEGPVADNVDYENTIGFAFQGGFDYNLNDKWFLNLDAKYLLLNTDVTVDATSALGATVGADVDINPIIIGFGVGYRF